ncbi:hypothetical protein ACW5W8_23135, partial [Aeromonas aquatilis]
MDNSKFCCCTALCICCNKAWGGGGGGGARGARGPPRDAMLATFSTILSTLTLAVAGIGAISLLVS